MDFPRLVYRGPTVFRLVEDQEGYEAALAAGWNHGHAEPASVAAIDAIKGESAESLQEYASQKLADLAPPTRDEMLAQLAKLGVDVDKRWGDKRLAAEIAKAMEAK